MKPQRKVFIIVSNTINYARKVANDLKEMHPNLYTFEAKDFHQKIKPNYIETLKKHDIIVICLENTDSFFNINLIEEVRDKVAKVSSDYGGNSEPTKTIVLNVTDPKLSFINNDKSEFDKEVYIIISHNEWYAKNTGKRLFKDKKVFNFGRKDLVSGKGYKDVFSVFSNHNIVVIHLDDKDVAFNNKVINDSCDFLSANYKDYPRVDTVPHVLYSYSTYQYQERISQKKERISKIKESLDNLF